MLHAPKVTTFENDHAKIFDKFTQHYVSQVEKVETSRVKGFRPIVKAVDIGWWVDIAGSFSTDGTNIAVDVHDSNLIAMHNVTRKERLGDLELLGTYQIPSMTEHRCRVACDVPDEASLVVSMGLQINETPIFGGATAIANKVLDSIGVSLDPPKSVTCERLVVITPRRIVLAPEKERVELDAR